MINNLKNSFHNMILRRDFKKRRMRRIISAKYLKLILFLGLLWLIHRVLWSTLGTQDQLAPVNLTYVVVHIDLKRTPLKLKYLESLLPTLKTHGVNGLLMEYEDMFPFEERLVNLSAKTCYDKKELTQFVTVATKSGIEIIPLIQTFGHMEYVLKLDEFKHLREDPKYEDSICPSKDASLDLIREMLEQVINFHNSIVPLKHIHVGCDEVLHMKKCVNCLRKNLPKQWLYLNHVTKVTAIVKILSMQTNVLVWDDMIRTISPANWNYDYKLPVEPVYWSYASHVNVSHASLYKYRRTYSDIWIASAFKGADGNKNTVPIIRNRFYNHFTWLKTIRNYKFGREKNTYNFKGIILTGWSRYAHKSPSCDLLPAALPSLVLNLLLIEEFKAGTINPDIATEPKKLYEHFEIKLKSALRCKNVFIEFDNPISSEFDQLGLERCNFEGSMLYETLKMYEILNLDIASNAKQHKVGEHLKKDCDDAWGSIQFLENELAQNMWEYYEETFINEFIFDKILNLKVALKNCLDSVM